MTRNSETPWIVPGKWHTSLHNWTAEVRKDWKLPKKVIFYDVTLRDGEQAAGVVFRPEDKLKIAHSLAEAGVQRIEGGMVAVSQEDADAIAKMAKEIKSAEISTFCRARKDDVELALKCNIGRVCIEVVARDEQINSIWGSRAKAAEALVNIIKFAKSNGLKVTMFLMEFSRADIPLLESLIIPAVKEANADSVAAVDTRGCALPQTMAFLVKKVKEWVNVPVEIHCHNQWGVATAGTLAAVEEGAEVVHSCVNGLNGNACLDECAMGIEGLLGIQTGIKLDKMFGLSKLVKELSGADWYKPFVGPTISQVEAGIPVRTMWDHRDEPGMGRIEFLNYGVVGNTPVDLVLGKKSGRYSIMLKAYELKLPVPPEDKANKMLERVKELSSEKKGLVSAEEFRGIYKEIMAKG